MSTLTTIDRFVDWLLLGPHAGDNPKTWRYDLAYGFSRQVYKLRNNR